MANADITAERLRDLLHYNPDTGLFTWRRSRARKGAGEVAGHVIPLGRTRYVYIGIDYRQYRAHRLVWLYERGTWPTAFLDHINGDGADNRLCNLREATCSQNGQAPNRRLMTNNKSGYTGVSFHAERKRWMAMIAVNGKRKWLGGYSSPEEAHAAYQKAKRDVHAFSGDGLRPGE
jgi:hypothetical protein